MIPVLGVLGVLGNGYHAFAQSVEHLDIHKAFDLYNNRVDLVDPYVEHWPIENNPRGFTLHRLTTFVT